MVSDLPVVTPAECADYYGSMIYSGIMCIDASNGQGVCNVCYWSFCLKTERKV